jgi:hypothetical protein
MNMKMYNVLPPTVITRSRDNVPQIVQFIQKIVELGYTYEIDSSIYFDASRFYKEHLHSKLQLDSIDRTTAVNKKEELTTSEYTSKEKENFDNFLLWKHGKPGELLWPSYWGQGQWRIQRLAIRRPPPPLDSYFFIFPPQKRKNTGYTASNRLRKPFFLHGRHPLTDFLDPPLVKVDPHIIRNFLRWQIYF